MKILTHFKHSVFAVLPIAVIVTVVDLCFMNLGSLIPFLIGSGILIIGQTLFLMSVDSSVVKMGDLVAGSVTRKNGLVLILLFALVFGVLSTIAEPDIQVLASEISAFGIKIPKVVFVIVVGIGVGVFCVIGIFRTVLKIPIWIIVLVSYGCVFILACFLPVNYISVAFDASSASTGIVAAPFLIALCSGVGSKTDSNSRSNNFGLIGITSIGPVLAVMIMFLCVSSSASSSAFWSFSSGNLFVDALINVALAIVPMLFVFFVFDFAFLHLSWKVNFEILINFLVMSIGLFLIVSGLDFGFIGMAKELGGFLGEKNLGILLMVLCSIFGFCIAFAEPAVRVLGKQVEDASNGNIKSILVVISVGLSLMIGMILAIVSVWLNWNMAYLLIIVLGLSLLLMVFAPNSFIAISFDSGGVALGPTSSAFLFPLVVGFASSFGVDVGFGTLALLGLVPCVVLQVIGVVYSIKNRSIPLISYVYSRKRRSFSGVDKYSDFEDLENFIMDKYGEL